MDIADGLARLAAAYPDHLAAPEPNVLVWNDGERMVYDDGRRKDFADLLAVPDLEDQMAMPYPAGDAFAPPPAPLADPGRVRHEPFFRKMYGGTPEVVRARLATIRWLPHGVDIPLLVTTVNNVHERLAAVSAALEALPPRERAFADNPAGTWCWRTIKDTGRLSMHSFGMAIDLNVAGSSYWKWDNPQAAPDDTVPYKGRMPGAIVRIFEAQGFIWGGKWHHYDSMHFEYRPELLPQGR
ncbi:MAG: M15 family metallopeptidase [Desulfovibrionaceae bacterium]